MQHNDPMKSRCWFAFTLLIAVPAVPAAPHARQHSPRPSAQHDPTDSVDSWMRENYSRALALLLPDSCASAIDARWRSCIRIIPSDKNESEYAVSLQRRFDGKMFAVIVRPKGASIYAQLREHKRKHPHASLGALAKMIAIESRTGDQSQFSGLEHLGEKFEELRISPVLSDEVTMDPTEYRFRFRSFAGETMEVTLNGPGSTAAHQSQPLIEWAESAKNTLAESFN